MTPPSWLCRRDAAGTVTEVNSYTAVPRRPA